MQREIKFRAKLVDNGNWVYGCLLKRWVGTQYKHYIVDGLYEHEVIPETVCQYTGINDNSDCLLEDREDKEIYSDDIVSVSYKGKSIKARIDFGLGMYILASNEFSDGYIPIAEVSNQDREYEWIDGLVIGNIYENPELLNQPSTDTP